MKKILYATDFSKNAEKAFDFALNIAEKHHADLIMLHVFDTPPVWGHPYITDPAEMAIAAIKSYESKLQEFFEQYESGLQPAFIAVENNAAVKGILSMIKEHKPDLVVTGTKGKSKLKEIFVGSTTKALVKESPAPVLAIPENSKYKDFNKVLYASDFQEVDLWALEQLIELVKPYKPEIRIIHVSTESEYKGHEKMEWFKDLVKDNISYKNISFELLLSDTIFERVNTYQNQYDYDMMVMLEKERHGIVKKLFNEDLVWKMEFHTRIPLLSYNEHYIHAKDDQDIKKSDKVDH